jgi:hypothetical protein
MTEISITQGLAELKLLKSRLDSAISSGQYVALKTKARPIDTVEFSRTAQGYYQSYSDLLSRYNRIKSAIVISNATTHVSIASKEYTVAEAIEHKRNLHMKKTMLSTLQTQLKTVNDSFARHTNDIQARAERLLEVELGKDSKTNVENSNQFVESFLKSNKAEIIDPLKLDTLIAELSKEISEFETTVDWVLSESNGRTKICV